MWSKLYKISPESDSNPNDEICEKTYGLMDEILCEELKFYKPRKVWFITEPYKKIFGDRMFWKYENGTTFKNTRNHIKDNKIVAKLFSRPERRKFDDIIKNAEWIK